MHSRHIAERWCSVLSALLLCANIFVVDIKVFMPVLSMATSDLPAVQLLTTKQKQINQTGFPDMAEWCGIKTH